MNRALTHISQHFGKSGLIRILPVLLSVTIFSQCNFSAQSYNFGKMLNPGETHVTVGIGQRPIYSIKDTFMEYARDTKPEELVIKEQMVNFCYDYRLGILEKYPLGKGLEFGFHLETPVQREGRNGGSATMLLEFDLRAGLPPAVIGNGVFHHNVGAGWTVGSYVDNGWYAEYAAGWEVGQFIPYTNVRALITATDMTAAPFDSTSNDRFFKYHDRNFIIRHALGLACKLPRMPFLPDYFIPEVSVAYPEYNRFQQVGFTYHLGLRWLNGF